jgi:hypothetical protein
MLQFSGVIIRSERWKEKEKHKKKGQRQEVDDDNGSWNGNVSNARKEVSSTR